MIRSSCQTFSQTGKFCSTDAKLPHNYTPSVTDESDQALGLYGTQKSQTLVGSHKCAEYTSPLCGVTANQIHARRGRSSTDAESLKPMRPWRNRCHRKFYRMMYIVLAYTAVILLINGFRVFNGGLGGNGKMSAVFQQADVLERNKREVVSTESSTEPQGTTECTPRSVGNFPGNFMTDKDTRNGGFVIHLLVAIYMFAALAVVCDDYFVPSLEHICEDLGLQADVAGATFMAAGSSAPEFMTSVVGVFIANSDVGVGTIVGSAVFNILFIIGVCGIFAGMVVELTWYPLVRDVLFYLLSVLTLYLTIRDQQVYWYESLIMVLLYAVYILIMYFNRTLERRCRALVVRMKAQLGRQPLVSKPSNENDHEITDDMKRARANSRISQASTVSSSAHEDRPPARMDDTTPKEQETQILPNSENSKTSSTESAKSEDHITVSEFESVWKIPDNFFVRCIWVAMVPLRALFHVTIPDSRRPGVWSRLYMLSFTMSVVWISVLTYLMVWMVTIAGDALDIPDTVMGLTILAAGTSVPDCLSSLFVARDGYGDMAVSNSLGSNVFDILMCLGLPWLIEGAIKNGDSVQIDSAGLTYSTLTLLATVAFLLVSMGINKWRLTKAYGVLCLIAYLIVTTLSCLFELNVFEEINAPACPK